MITRSYEYRCRRRDSFRIFPGDLLLSENSQLGMNTPRGRTRPPTCHMADGCSVGR